MGKELYFLFIPALPYGHRFVLHSRLAGFHLISVPYSQIRGNDMKPVPLKLAAVIHVRMQLLVRECYKRIIGLNCCQYHTAFLISNTTSVCKCFIRLKYTIHIYSYYQLYWERDKCIENHLSVSKYHCHLFCIITQL